MNIFKILANGDGRVNEANISAFLGYLLDPYQDHGLGFEFLDRFLETVFENQEENFDLRSYDYEILFEQAFRDEDKEIKKKEIVDIVILCFESNKGNYKELIAESTITKTRELKYIFLLENKITIGAKTDQQLKAQFQNTIKKLGIDKSKIISLYVTPNEKIYEDEFNSLENPYKEHYVWKSKEEDDSNGKNGSSPKNDIKRLLSELISAESRGEIEAINQYTKHTLISFIKFIENDFKSQIIEKIENAEGKYKKDISHSIDGYFSKYENNLNAESNNAIREFNAYLKKQHKDLVVRHSKTHPISILQNQNNGKIFTCTRYGKKLEFHFKVSGDNRKKIEHYLMDKKYNFIGVPWGIIIRENLDIESLKEIFKSYREILLSNVTPVKLLEELQ